MITIKELHEKTLPENKKKAVKRDVISYYLWRPICDFSTILLIGTNVTATTITKISFYSCLLALVTFIFVTNKIGALLAWGFLWIWNILDGVDGNIARYKDQCSKQGDLWDAVAGYLCMFVMYFGMGIVAYNENSILNLDFISKEYYIIIGSIAAVCMIFPRLVTQKKSAVFGKESVNNVKDKTSYGLIKTLILNINSINGLSSLLFLLAIVFNMVNIYVVIYGVINLIFAIGAMIVVMKGLRE